MSYSSTCNLIQAKMNTTFKFILVVFIFYIAGTESVILDGQCPQKPPVQPINSFNLNRYLGVWYEIEKYGDENSTDIACVRYRYTRIQNNIFNIRLEQKNSNQSWNYESLNGHGGVSYPCRGMFCNVPGILNTTFEATPPPRMNYYILATDYRSYAFVWDCENVSDVLYDEKIFYLSRYPYVQGRPWRVADLIKRYFNEMFITQTYHGWM